MEGWLHKKGDKGPIKAWKRRYFRQYRDKLLYFKSDISQDTLGFIPLDQVKSVHPSLDIKDREYALQINTDGRVFFLAAETESSFNEWLTRLVSFIKVTGTEERLLQEQIQADEEEERRKSRSPRNSSGSTRLTTKFGRSISKKGGQATLRGTSNEISKEAGSQEPQMPPLVVPERPVPLPRDRSSANNSTPQPRPGSSSPRSSVSSVSSSPSEDKDHLRPLESPRKKAMSPRSRGNSPRVVAETQERPKRTSREKEATHHVTVKSPRSIGTNVLGLSAPGRPPPPPPEESDDEDEVPSIGVRVSGIVQSTPAEQFIEASPNEPIAPRASIWQTPSSGNIPNRVSQRSQGFLLSRTSVVPLDENISHRTKLVREVVSSEESYVRSLGALVHHFYKPLQMSNDKRAQREMVAIFGNIEQILHLNGDLLQQLQDRVGEWSDTALLGDIFITIAPFLKLYATYGNNYENAIHLYQKEMKENVSFRDFVDKRNLEAGESVALHHLLIMPIQRIPRYNMLLSDILKHTESDHPDYKNLQEALQSTKAVATHLNESVRASEAERNLAELAERMDLVFLLAPHRRLVKEGAYKIIVKKKEKHNPHHLILFNDILVCISRSKIRKSEEFTQPQNKAPLQLVWYEVALPEKQLRITTPTQQFAVLFETPEELNQWKDALQATLAENKQAQSGDDPNVRQGDFIFPGGVTYSGSWRSGKKHGSGQLVFHHNHYEGEFAEDVMNGKGKITYASGALYTGEWKDGLPHGQGTYGAPDGETYDGEWKAGRRDGQGKMAYSNGDVYTGRWLRDLPHGAGKMVYSAGQRYDGEWVRGQRSGRGSFEYGAGRQYEGEWLQDKPHGHGTLLESDGTYYEGQFFQGAFEGSGTMLYKDGRKYAGQWRNGKPHGTGKYASALGIVQQYEGEWVNGQLHGKGQVYFANKDKYTGYLRDNYLHGNGVYEQGPLSLEGKWNMGQMEGKVMVRVGEDDTPRAGTADSNAIHFSEAFAPPMILPPLNIYVQVSL